MNVSNFGPAPRKNGLFYPGKRPSHSYVMTKDSVTNIHPVLPINTTMIPTNQGTLSLKEFLNLYDQDIDNRYCVLGYGSNACPAQLYDKFKDTILLVLRGTITNYDIVYANAITKYGSIPATIIDSPGTIVEVWATILDEEQLCIMDDSEGRDVSYYLGKLNGKISIDGIGETTAYSYVHAQGAFNYKNKPIRISDIPVQNPIYDGLNQIEILELFSSLIGEPKLATNQIKDNMKYRVKYTKKLHQISTGIMTTQYIKIPIPNIPDKFLH